MPIVVGTPQGVNVGACSPWATTDDICEPCNGDTFDPILLNDCLQAASDILFDLSGRQFAGQCQDTVRPTAQEFSPDHGRPIAGGYQGDWYTGQYWGGQFSPWGFCGCNRTERSGCNTIPEITLGVYPLTRIVQVLVDGVALPADQYRIDDNRFLVRLADSEGNPQGWPCCQSMTEPTSAVGTWAVTVAYGTPPPVLGKLAAAELACQLSLAIKPSQGGECQLPQRVIQITSQGLSKVVSDPLTLIKDGFQGLPISDRFIRSVNPAGIPRRSTVLSPDIGRRTRRAGT